MADATQRLPCARAGYAARSHQRGTRSGLLASRLSWPRSLPSAGAAAIRRGPPAPSLGPLLSTARGSSPRPGGSPPFTTELLGSRLTPRRTDLFTSAKRYGAGASMMESREWGHALAPKPTITLVVRGPTFAPPPKPTTQGRVDDGEHRSLASSLPSGACRSVRRRRADGVPAAQAGRASPGSRRRGRGSRKAARERPPPSVKVLVSPVLSSRGDGPQSRVRVFCLASRTSQGPSPNPYPLQPSQRYTAPACREGDRRHPRRRPASKGPGGCPLDRGQLSLADSGPAPVQRRVAPRGPTIGSSRPSVTLPSRLPPRPRSVLHGLQEEQPTSQRSPRLLLGLPFPPSTAAI